jgi:ParB family chromosome partitioning protein
MKLKGLGRGLDALLAGNEAVGKEQQRALPVSSLQPGKYQPRTQMDPASLDELAASIRAQGLMQPILVRPLGNTDEERFEIVAGERRWRAAQMAGMSEVPTLIREIPDESALAMALIENIQRENLNPLEEAQGLQRLIDEFSMTHQQAADAVGRSRPAASNLLRFAGSDRATRGAKRPVGAGNRATGAEFAETAEEDRREDAGPRRVAPAGRTVRPARRTCRDTGQPPGGRQGSDRIRQPRPTRRDFAKAALAACPDFMPEADDHKPVTMPSTACFHHQNSLSSLRSTRVYRAVFNTLCVKYIGFPKAFLTALRLRSPTDRAMITPRLAAAGNCSDSVRCE